MPVPGFVGNLVAAYSDDGRRAAVDEVGQGVLWISGSGPGRKRIRLNRKTPAHLVGNMSHSRPKVWKRLRHVGSHLFLILITKGGDVSRIMMVSFLLMKGLGWVDSLGMRSMPQGCMFFN